MSEPKIIVIHTDALWVEVIRLLTFLAGLSVIVVFVFGTLTAL